MDRIVFDIETKNDFASVGGRNNIKDLLVSVVCIYSYEQDAYSCYEESELPALGEMFQKSELIITFNGKNFDVPVLEKYFKFNLSKIRHYDIFEEIQERLGRRMGLDPIAQANLGLKKSSHGLEAIKMFREGRIQELKDYCTQDVKVTKEIYELIKRQQFLWIPNRDNLGPMHKLEIPYQEELSSQSSLF